MSNFTKGHSYWKFNNSLLNVLEQLKKL